MTLHGAARPTLSREVIADAALDLTDQVGLRGLSMRKLGAELGVEAMSLYHYVKNKDDLLDAILERLYLRVELPKHLPVADWETAIRLSLQALHSVLIGHPAAIELFSSRTAPSAEAFEVLSWAYSRFGAVGLSPQEAHAAVHVAVSYAMGSAANEIGSLAQVRAGESVELTMVEDQYLAETLAHAKAVPPAQIFESGVDLVVAGLRAKFDLP